MHASKALSEQLSKPSAPLTDNECEPFLSLLHEAPVCGVEWDRRWPMWLSDRTYPAGIVVLERAYHGGKQLKPISYGEPICDKDIEIGDTEPQPLDRTKQPFFVLESAASR
jgi:hypothetical protein